MNLKRYAALGGTNTFTWEDRFECQRTPFDPEELIQVKDMTDLELTHLMLFCGIRTFNDTPIVTLTEDDKRLAYVLWRVEQLKEQNKQLADKAERGVKWLKRFQQVVEVLTK